MITFLTLTENLKSTAHFIFEKMEFARWTFDFQRMRTQILIPYGVLSLLYMLQSHFVHNHCIESGLNQIGTDGGKVWWFGCPHDLERTTSYRNHHSSGMIMSVRNHWQDGLHNYK